MADRVLLILANGDWGGDSDRTRLHALVQRASHIVAVDGALDRASQYGIKADTLIGDLDSLLDTSRLEERFPGLEIHRYPEDKDWTDLELAIDWAVEQAPASIVVFGAAGGRIDHTMANLALLEKGLHSGIPIRLIAGDESVRLIQGDLSLEDAVIGDRLSLLPVSLFCTVTTRGLKYPLTHEKLFRGQGRGISNCVVSRPTGVSVESGIVAVIHAPGSHEDG
jgi:thiamine pyrophosphokinase